MSIFEINIAVFPTFLYCQQRDLIVWKYLQLNNSTIFRTAYWITYPGSEDLEVKEESKIGLSINTTNSAFLYFSISPQSFSIPNILWILKSQHEVFIIPHSISLFHFVSLPFSYNNFIIILLKLLLFFFFSFVCSSPKSFSPSIQTILSH